EPAQLRRETFARLSRDREIDKKAALDHVGDPAVELAELAEKRDDALALRPKHGSRDQHLERRDARRPAGELTPVALQVPAIGQAVASAGAQIDSLPLHEFIEGQGSLRRTCGGRVRRPGIETLAIQKFRKVELRLHKLNRRMLGRCPISRGDTGAPTGW